MAINITTKVEISSKPKFRLSPASKSKKGEIYPDSLEVTYHDFTEYENKDGDIVDGERKYQIGIKGSSVVEGVTSTDVRELNNLLRSHDYSKKPLVLDCEMFKNGMVWANEVKQFVSERDAYSSDAVLGAKELLASLKK